MKARYAVGAIILSVAALGSVYLLSKSRVQYTTIAEARSLGTIVQIKGRWVDRDQAVYDATRNQFRFVLEDDQGERTQVIYTGAKPNNFELAEAIVVRGRMKGSYFEATSILTKCPSKYEGSASQLGSQRAAQP